MIDPRSANGARGWLTDSRVYNLVWLGRWMERLDGVTRGIEAAVRSSTPPIYDALYPNDAAFVAGLANVVYAWGLTPPANGTDRDAMLTEVGDLMNICLRFASDDAAHVGALELIQGLNTLLEDLPRIWGAVTTPEEALAAAHTIRTRINDVTAAVETRWYHTQAATE
jgi:hypothetical protein